MPRGDQNETMRWLSATLPLRGVNLGSQFIVEPWMASDEWNSMGCGGTASEFDCVSKLGQTQANKAWAMHWNTWTTQEDISKMRSYGLNAIRIPVGYWIREDLVYSNSEHFPQGGLHYLEQICGWASNAGLYIIIDLHGAPGAQVARNADTGQIASTPGFYVDYQYERAYKFLEWMANIIHTDKSYRNVGMLEILSQPVQGSNSETDSMRQTFYPTAWARIRAAEAALKISPNNLLHIQMMNAKWGSGDPHQHLTDDTFAAYDDHRYLKYSDDNGINDPGTGRTPAAYLKESCHDDRGGNWPTVVGEFSLSVADDLEWNSSEFAPPDSHVGWYAKWFAAQIQAYEKQDGWIFWSWKVDYIAGRNDWRWSYQAAVTAGAIPQNLKDAVNSNPCAGI
ncbi:hypothetical protein HO173_012979 [Letharia columbiana]|uniref:glucan endo-1,6-beta-glucosidase n=1 Tax=Letharia columbiana TaxID=112416 RepID=A0A8H6CK03_9LECA|nr:uncharacterized protein HO173_012979 [Letharia columbiana]KAF6224636.1 hypothetical protein HO173_012979 [Letharia columbiana]